MYNKILTLEGNNIIVIYTKMYETVARMVLKYYDTEQFEKTAFVINVLVDENSNDIDYRTTFPNWNKYIYYQLNNLFLYSEDVAEEHMNQFDEIWECTQAHNKYYPQDVISKVVFMPLRYINLPKIEPKEEYKYDLCFIDTITPFRGETISRLTKYWTNDYCKVKTINGYPYTEMADDISDCKYILDIPRRIDSGIIVNHVRIFESICSGKNIIIENGWGYDNIYTYLVKTYGNITEVLNIIKEDPIDNSETFRKWTESNYNYEEWRKYWMGNNYKQKLNL